MLSVTVTVTLHAIERRKWSSSNNSSFYIFAIQSIPWSSVKTTEVLKHVVVAKNQFMVLAIVVQKVDARGTDIISRVRKYPLGCTIPCTQSILLFSFLQ